METNMTKDITGIEEREIIIKTATLMLKIMAVITAAICIISSIIPTLQMSVDMFYMLDVGEQTLNTGHLPEVWEGAFNTIPLDHQNWLGATLMALEYRLGSLVGHGITFVHICHGIEVLIMLLVGRWLAKRYSKSEMLPSIAMLLLCAQYSIAQTRVHASCATLLMLYIHQLLQLKHEKKLTAKNTIAAIIIALTYANLQRSIAICLPLCAIPIIALDIKDKEANKPIAITAIISTITMLCITPPNTMGLFNGITALSGSKIGTIIEEVQPMIHIGEKATAEAIANLLTTTLVAVMASRSQKREIQALAAMSEIVIIAAIIWSARLQQISITLTAMTLIIAFDEITSFLKDTKPKETKAILIISTIALIAVTQLNTIPHLGRILITLPNAQQVIIENDTTDPMLGYPDKEMTKDINNKNVFANSAMSTYMDWLGANVMVNSRFETFAKDTEIDDITYEVIVSENTPEPEAPRDVLPQKKGITDKKIDIMILPQNTILKSMLDKNKSWKATATQTIENIEYTRFDNVDNKTFEEQGIAENTQHSIPKLLPTS